MTPSVIAFSTAAANSASPPGLHMIVGLSPMRVIKQTRRLQRQPPIRVHASQRNVIAMATQEGRGASHCRAGGALHLVARNFRWMVHVQED